MNKFRKTHILPFGFSSLLETIYKIIPETQKFLLTMDLMKKIVENSAIIGKTPKNSEKLTFSLIEFR